MTSVTVGLSALTLFLFYAVMAAFIVMLWRLTKELAQIKQSIADLRRAVALIEPRGKTGD
jgi:hypothetical protein